MLGFVPALLGAALQAGLLVVAVRKRTSLVVVWAILVAPVVVLLADTTVRVVSHHGLMHASIVYSLREGGFPAENPIWAGETLRYPHGLHLVIAGLTRAFPIAPPWWFAGASLVSLGIFTVAIHRATRYLITDSASGPLLAAVLCCTGVSPFARGPFADLLSMLGVPDEPRIVPFSKFINVNCNQVGIALFAVLLMLVLRTTRSASLDRAAIGYLFLVTVLLGLLYPPAWSGGLVCVVLAALHHLVLRQRNHAVALFACALLAAVVVSPWIDSLAHGLRIELFARAPRNILIVLGVLLFPATVVAATRQWTSLTIVPARTLLILLTSGLIASFVGPDSSAFNEYKLLSLAQIPLGILLAVVLTQSPWNHRKVSLIFGLLLLLLLPFWSQVAPLSRTLGTSPNPYTSTVPGSSGRRATQDLLT